MDTAYNFFVSIDDVNERRVWEKSCQLLDIPSEW